MENQVQAPSSRNFWRGVLAVLAVAVAAGLCYAFWVSRALDKEGVEVMGVVTKVYTKTEYRTRRVTRRTSRREKVTVSTTVIGPTGRRTRIRSGSAATPTSARAIPWRSAICPTIRPAAGWPATVRRISRSRGGGFCADIEPGARMAAVGRPEWGGSRPSGCVGAGRRNSAPAFRCGAASGAGAGGLRHEKPRSRFSERLFRRFFFRKPQIFAPRFAGSIFFRTFAHPRSAGNGLQTS